MDDKLCGGPVAERVVPVSSRVFFAPFHGAKFFCRRVAACSGLGVKARPPRKWKAKLESSWRDPVVSNFAGVNNYDHSDRCRSVLASLNLFCHIGSHEGETLVCSSIPCTDYYNVNNNAGKRSLFDRLGGIVAVEAATRKLYEYILADESLRKFFDGVEMSRQRQMMASFVNVAFGGPASYSGRGLREAHAHLGITESDFVAVCKHFQSTLMALNVPTELIDEALAIVSSTQSQVVGTSA